MQKILLVRAGGKSKILNKNKVLAKLVDHLYVLDLILSLGNSIHFDYRYLHVYGEDKDINEFKKLANRHNYIIIRQNSSLRGESMKEFAQFLQNTFHDNYFLTILSGDSPFLQKNTLEYLIDLFQSSKTDFLLPLQINENISQDRNFLELSNDDKKCFKQPFILSSSAVDQCSHLNGEERITTIYDKLNRIIIHPIFKVNHDEYFKIDSEKNLLKARELL
jgi:CTP:molybdopterin cytidylyltransferase MocA